MTNGAHVGGKILCFCVCECVCERVHVCERERVHTPMLAANLWRRLRDRRWSGFLHVRPVAGGNILPEAPSPDQSNLFNIKSVFMDRDQKNSLELIIIRCWRTPNKRDVKAGITSCRLQISVKTLVA